MWPKEQLTIKEETLKINYCEKFESCGVYENLYETKVLTPTPREDPFHEALFALFFRKEYHHDLFCANHLIFLSKQRSANYFWNMFNGFMNFNWLVFQLCECKIGYLF